MTPVAPQVAARRFQLIGFAGSRSLECRKLEWASMIWPSAPDRMTWKASWAPGKNGISLEQRTNRPGSASIAATSRSAAARSIPNGFSPRKSLPAATASA